MNKFKTSALMDYVLQKEPEGVPEPHVVFELIDRVNQSPEE